MINYHDVLAITVSKMATAIVLIIAIILGWAGVRMAMQVIDGLRNRCFEITDKWEINFNGKPVRYCFLVILYSLFSIVVLYLSMVAIYDLLAR